MLISNEAQNYTSGQVLIKTDVNGNIINLMDQSGTTINTPLIDPDTGTLINPATGLPIRAPLVIAAGTSLIPIGKLAQAATVDQTDHRVMTSPVDFRAAAVILGHVGPAPATFDAASGHAFCDRVCHGIANGRVTHYPRDSPYWHTKATAAAATAQ